MKYLFILNSNRGSISNVSGAKPLNGRIVPSFVIFSPGLPNNAPHMVLPVFGPPRVGPLGVCISLGSINTGSTIDGHYPTIILRSPFTLFKFILIN